MLLLVAWYLNITVYDFYYFVYRICCCAHFSINKLFRKGTAGLRSTELKMLHTPQGAYIALFHCKAYARVCNFPVMSYVLARGQSQTISLVRVYVVSCTIRITERCLHVLAGVLPRRGTFLVLSLPK